MAYHSELPDTESRRTVESANGDRRWPSVTSRPVDLPDFANPPVAEVVLSVQFEALSRMRAAHFGLFWARIRDRYPRTEERPALETRSEERRVGKECRSRGSPYH